MMTFSKSSALVLNHQFTLASKALIKSSANFSMVALTRDGRKSGMNWRWKRFGLKTSEEKPEQRMNFLPLPKKYLHRPFHRTTSEKYFRLLTESLIDSTS